MKSFEEFVSAYLMMLQQAREIPLGIYSPLEWLPLQHDAPTVAILSAHPDDEVMTSMPLGIRLKRSGYRVVNVAVTVGSPGQSERRIQELRGACRYMGVELIVPGGKGLRELIHPDGTVEAWGSAVEIVSQVLSELRPKVVIVHHEDDAHHDHIAANKLTMQALERLSDTDCILAMGEYWRDMKNPNVQLEVSEEDLVILLKALSFHKGELARNPYHLTWPPFMSVKVRYSEIVTGWGTHAPEFKFAVMYRLRRWRNGHLEEYLQPIALDKDAPISGILPFDEYALPGIQTKG